MISVVEWIPAVGAPEIAVDPYVPITVTFPGYRGPEAPRSVVLRGTGGVVELKARAATGELVEVVVPAGVPAEVAGSFGVVRLEHPDAVPMLAFPDDAAICEAQIALAVREDALEIRLADREPTAFGGTREVRYGYRDDGELVMIVARISAAQAVELLER